MTLETCRNCGHPIGALEAACVWNDLVVCPACHARLSAASSPPVPTPAPAVAPAPLPAVPLGYATPRPMPPPVFTLAGRADGPVFICPNPQCGYHGASIRKAKGSAVVGLLLLFIMVLPGILYFIFMSGYTHHCPRCGVEVKL